MIEIYKLGLPGIFLIKWDEVEGGVVYLKCPDDLDIPENVVQQIQISHDFVESKITLKEKDWNSISYYNTNKQLITVLILDKYADSSDYTELIEDFNRELDKNVSEQAILKKMNLILNANVFRTKDEVILKISNELAQMKMKNFDLESRFEKVMNSDHLNVKNKILVLLTKNDGLNFNEIKKAINTSKRRLEKEIKMLVKDETIGYDENHDNYYLIF